MAPPNEAQPSDASEPDPLEMLIAEALSVLEQDGTPGIARFLKDHPEDAAAVRAALRDLDHIDLLNQPQAPLPRQIGDFEIKGELGSGGMGVVYVAEQKSLGREVALKMVRPEMLLFEGARERFRREIDAVARLDHPAIIPILATGTENDVPFYAMPRLRGCDAERIVKQLAHRNPDELRGSDLRTAIGDGSDASATDLIFTGSYWQAVLRLIHQAALGIQHAHVRGVLHRDIKPSNLFLTQTGQAVVFDFGLARASEDQKLTRSGAAAGSPAYMAPEQVRGEPADERTDTYALAATMHCLLSLRPPFSMESREGLNTRILNGDRHPLRVSVPAEVRIVLDCGMDVDRGRRYATCQEFANDLLAVLEGQPITARKLPTGVRVRRFVQRHRTIAVAAGMALAFLLLVPALLWRQASEASAAMREQVQKTRDEVIKKQRANLALARTNEKLGNLNQELASTNTALGEANRKLGEANDKLGTSNEELNATNDELERVNELLKEQVARSDRSAALSLDAIRRLLAGTNTKKLRDNRAALPVLSTMLGDALELFENLEVSEELQDEVLELQLETLSGLVDIKAAMGKFDEAIAVTERSVELTEGKDQTDQLRSFRATAMSHKASLLMDQAKHDGVRELLDGARAIHAELSKTTEFGYRSVQQLSLIEGMVGALAMRERRLPDAEAALRRAIEWTAKLDPKGTSDPVHATNELNLIRFLKMQKRYDEALPLAEALVTKLDGLPSPTVVTWPTPAYIRTMARNERMRILQLKGDLDESLACADVVIGELSNMIREYASIPELPRLRSSTYGNVGGIYYSREQWDDAIRYMDLAVRDAETALAMSPGERQALKFRATHQRLLVVSLRRNADWNRLEVEAQKLGKLRIPPLWRVGAARELLRCAQHRDPERAAALRELSIQWLEQANQAGQVFTDDGLFDPIRTDERFRKLKKR